MKPSIHMLSPFFCGSFQPEDEDDYGPTLKTSPSTTPRRSFIKRQSFCSRTHNTNNKNPYSSRGLDKFEALLADLEEKKKKIYTQVDPDDISLVRFAYTSSNDCVPIVVKSKDVNKNNNNNAYNNFKSPPREDKTPSYAEDDKTTSHAEDDKTTSYGWRVSFDQWRKPSYYMPAAVVLIMVLLVFFGRSVAILCTSMGWYMIPAFGSPENNVSGKKKKEKKRKKEGRESRDGVSENGVVQRDGLHSPEKITSPTVASPRPEKHGHRRSW